jgi:hypothetical protein
MTVVIVLNWVAIKSQYTCKNAIQTTQDNCGNGKNETRQSKRYTIGEQNNHYISIEMRALT